jgi:hypothetical protein
MGVFLSLFIYSLYILIGYGMEILDCHWQPWPLDFYIGILVLVVPHTFPELFRAFEPGLQLLQNCWMICFIDCLSFWVILCYQNYYQYPLERVHNLCWPLSEGEPGWSFELCLLYGLGIKWWTHVWNSDISLKKVKSKLKKQRYGIR